MARFNQNRKAANQVINRQGGTAYRQSPELRLVSLLLTSTVSNQYYRSAGAQLMELNALLAEVDARFAAQAAVYARNEFGLRTITHALAAQLAARASGTTWGASFYDRVVRRPDDMLEIAAAYLGAADSGNNLTNAMKKGFAAAFDRFDGYQLAKYRGEGKQVKLVDLVNLVRPIPTERNATALSGLVNDTLRNTGTWESKLSAAGQEEDTDEAKAAAWAELLSEGKLGYFALLRNLRNILEQAPECTELVVEQLRDPARIRNSLVLPFRLLSAYRTVEAMPKGTGLRRPGSGVLGDLLGSVMGAKFAKPKKVSRRTLRRKVLGALEAAIDVSLVNVPDLPRTLIAVDNSGSMCSRIGGSKVVACNQLGALFGIALAKRSKADLMEFGTTARYLDYGPLESTLGFAKDFEARNEVGHGTNFEAIFECAGTRAYDRIVILSDMQSGLHEERGAATLASYRKRSGADPYVYSIDLQGYGSSHFPAGGRLFQFAGYSEKVFDLMRLAEQDPRVLLRTIGEIEL